MNRTSYMVSFVLVLLASTHYANAQTVVVNDNSGSQTYCATDNQHLRIEGSGFQSAEIFDYTLTITGEGCSALHATTLVSRVSDTLLTIVEDLTGCTGDVFATLKYQDQEALQPVKIATINDPCIVIRDTSRILNYCPGPTRLLYVESSGVQFTTVFEFTFELTGEGCGLHTNSTEPASNSTEPASNSTEPEISTITIIEVTPVSDTMVYIVVDLSGCSGDIWAQLTYQSHTSERRKIATLSENCVSIVALNQSASTQCPQSFRTYCPGNPRLLLIEGTGFESTEPFDYTLTLTGDGCSNLRATTLVSRVSDTLLSVVDDLTGCTGDIWAVLNYKNRGFLQPVLVATIADDCVAVRDTSKVLAYCPEPMSILYVEFVGLNFTEIVDYNLFISGEGCSQLQTLRVTPVSDSLLCLVANLTDCTGDIFGWLNYTLPAMNNDTVTPIPGNNTNPDNGNSTTPDGEDLPTVEDPNDDDESDVRVIVLTPIKIAMLSRYCVFISNTTSQTYCPDQTKLLFIEGEGFESTEPFDYTLSVQGEGCSALHATTLVTRVSDTLLSIEEDLTGCTGDVFAVLNYQNKGLLEPALIATLDESCDDTET